MSSASTLQYDMYKTIEKSELVPSVVSLIAISSEVGVELLMDATVSSTEN